MNFEFINIFGLLRVTTITVSRSHLSDAYTGQWTIKNTKYCRIVTKTVLHRGGYLKRTQKFMLATKITFPLIKNLYLIFQECSWSFFSPLQRLITHLMNEIPMNSL